MSLDFLTPYGPEAEHASLPLGGLGAGMMSFTRNGSFESVSIRHKPEMHNDPILFASLHSMNNKKTRVIMGDVPNFKLTQARGTSFMGSGGGHGNQFGLPHYASYEYSAGFPFAELHLQDEAMPVQSMVTAWSPFIPGDDHHSGLPCAILEYELHNTSKEQQDLVFSFHSENFLQTPNSGLAGSARLTKHGFCLEATASNTAQACSGPCDCGPSDGEQSTPLMSSLSASLIGGDECVVDCGWFRSGWFDKRTALWDDISSGILRDRPSHREDNDCGASVGTRLSLKSGEKRTLKVLVTWYTPQYKVWDHAKDTITTWYATQYKSIEALNDYLVTNLDNIRSRTQQFAEAIHKNDMPAAFRSSVTRNLAILKSPSFLRAEDGRVWGWEGCHDDAGCCNGSCTHVYNYAQALAFLFPQLERGMRDVEFGPNQDETGHQQFRANLPFNNPFENRFHAAADGQLGGIVRMYRDWIISGESEWLRASWPRVKSSLEYCINAWDLDRNGRLAEPHHNTYDIEFWGEDGLCSTIYAAALKAAIAMAEYLGEETGDWEHILNGVNAVIRDELFHGWIRQKVHWKDLKADDPTAVSIGAKQDSPEANAIIEKEGPRYQYGEGVLIDAALGCQIARVAGLGSVIDDEIERAHIDAIMTHNYKSSLREHSCFQRPGYACADEAGTIMCSWPDGGRLSMPFPYSDEIWTGCEHHFAAHLCMLGRIDDAVKVEAAVVGRYDGSKRNPFNEIECGHFYIRALASYGLVPAFSGAHYNAVEQSMTLKPAISGDFKSFFAVGSNWGYIGVKDGEPFLDLIEGELNVESWNYTPYGAETVTT